MKQSLDHFTQALVTFGEDVKDDEYGKVLNDLVKKLPGVTRWTLELNLQYSAGNGHGSRIAHICLHDREDIGTNEAGEDFPELIHELDLKGAEDGN